MIFLAQFGQVIDPSTLYQHFATMRREPNEPISTFNARFQKVYSLITPAYKPGDALALEIYKNALDPMINIFLRRVVGVDTLSLAYAEVINIDRQLNPHGHPFPINNQANHIAPPLNPIPVIQAQPLTRLPPNQPLGVECGEVPRIPIGSGLVLAPANNHAQATLTGPNRNELETIQRMVQKLGNDFTSLQRQVGSQEVPQRAPFYQKYTCPKQNDHDPSSSSKSYEVNICHVALVNWCQVHGTVDHRELDCLEFCNAFEAIHKELGGYSANKSEHNTPQSNTAMVFDTIEPVLVEPKTSGEGVDEVHAF